MAQEHKFCTDCNFHISSMDGIWNSCTHQQVNRIDPVTGKTVHPLCGLTRLFGSACGPDAKLFVAKEVAKEKTNEIK